ncbi:MAG: patatin-like phospholipase family protein [Pseudomonadota bacterium]
MPNNIEALKRVQSKSYKYAVFSGGGAKGGVYPGVHEALWEAGVVRSLEAVAGASAGAITATFIATGISKKDCKRISKNTDFSNLLGEGLIQHDGEPIYELLHSTITHNISQYIGELYEVTDVRSVCLDRMEEISATLVHLVGHENYSLDALKIKTEQLEDERQKLHHLYENDGAEIGELYERVSQGDKVYFRDLALLKLLNPKKFKSLIITTTDKKTGELVVFSDVTTPDAEIALVCRASTSIPRILKPVTIDGVEYVDGGYRDNIPQRHFTGGITEPSARGENEKDRILVLAFGQNINDSANISVYSTKARVLSYGAVIGFLIDVICRVASGVGGSIRFTKSEEATYKDLRENALNVVVLGTGEVGTLSFATAQGMADYLHVKGRMQTMEHLRNHEMLEQNDIHFDHKNFMLSVYEQALLHTPKSKRSNEVLKELLHFCDNQHWAEGKSTSKVLTEYIQTAATDISDYRLKSTTPTMEALILGLNDKGAPDAIKQSFIDVLGMEIGPVAQGHLSKFKFKLEDFDELLNRHKQEKLLEASRDITKNIKVSRARNDLTEGPKKEVLKGGQSRGI